MHAWTGHVYAVVCFYAFVLFHVSIKDVCNQHRLTYLPTNFFSFNAVFGVNGKTLFGD